MGYQVLAEVVLVIHLAFVIFVVMGALLVPRWRWVAWLHLPAAAWGAWIMFVGWTCPLTPLENQLRHLAGQEGYTGGFIEHYILSILYPSGLTREMQFLLGAVVVLLNLAIYAYILYRSRGSSQPSEERLTTARIFSGRASEE